MSIIVQKYGGTSVADISCIKRVARRVKKTWAAGHRVVADLGDGVESVDAQRLVLKEGEWVVEESS